MGLRFFVILTPSNKALASGELPRRVGGRIVILTPSNKALASGELPRRVGGRIVILTPSKKALASGELAEGSALPRFGRTKGRIVFYLRNSN
jgi:hypothetical protein